MKKGEKKEKKKDEGKNEEKVTTTTQLPATIEVITQDKDVTALSQAASTWLTRAKEYEVKDRDTLHYATQTILSIREMKEKVKSKLLFFVGPLKTHIKNIETFFDGVREPLNEAEKAFNGKVQGYLLAEEEKKRREQREEEERRKRETPPPTPPPKPLEDDIWASDGEGFEYTPSELQSLQPSPIAPSPAPIPKTTHTDAGDVTLVKKWDVEVEDMGILLKAIVDKVVPMEAIKPDLGFLRSWVTKKVQKEIPGCKVFQKAHTRIEEN